MNQKIISDLETRRQELEEELKSVIQALLILRKPDEEPTDNFEQEFVSAITTPAAPDYRPKVWINPKIKASTRALIARKARLRWKKWRDSGSVTRRGRDGRIKYVSQS